jgi:hypothetical protein
MDELLNSVIEVARQALSAPFDCAVTAMNVHGVPAVECNDSVFNWF